MIFFPVVQWKFPLFHLLRLIFAFFLINHHNYYFPNPLINHIAKNIHPWFKVILRTFVVGAIIKGQNNIGMKVWFSIKQIISMNIVICFDLSESGSVICGFGSRWASRSGCTTTWLQGWWWRMTGISPSSERSWLGNRLDTILDRTLSFRQPCTEGKYSVLT